jgi:hypothetical protein
MAQATAMPVHCFILPPPPKQQLCHHKQIKKLMVIFTLEKVRTYCQRFGNLPGTLKSHNRSKRDIYMHTTHSATICTVGPVMPAPGHLPKLRKRGYKTSTSLGDGNNEW